MGEVVRNIVKEFLVKRNLIDAIRHRNSHRVKVILSRICPTRVRHILSQTIDSSLNTPLHYAVTYNFAEILQVLVKFGADANLRNMRGASPSQWFGLPRLNNAARVSRRL